MTLTLYSALTANTGKVKECKALCEICPTHRGTLNYLIKKKNLLLIIISLSISIAAPSVLFEFLKKIKINKKTTITALIILSCFQFQNKGSDKAIKMLLSIARHNSVR